MQSTLIQPKKSLKTKACVYIHLKDIHESIKKILGELLAGLAHLNIEVIFDEDESFESALEKIDMMLVLNEDEKLLQKAWKEGIVTITKPFSGSVVDYNPNTEKGNSFIFNNLNEWEVFAAIVRALETYKFPYDWKFIQRSCRQSV